MWLLATSCSTLLYQSSSYYDNDHTLSPLYVRIHLHPGTLATRGWMQIEEQIHYPPQHFQQSQWRFTDRGSFKKAPQDRHWRISQANKGRPTERERHTEKGWGTEGEWYGKHMLLNRKLLQITIAVLLNSGDIIIKSYIFGFTSYSAQLPTAFHDRMFFWNSSEFLRV